MCRLRTRCSALSWWGDDGLAESRGGSHSSHCCQRTLAFITPLSRETLCLFCTDEAGAKLCEGLGEGQIEGCHTWSGPKICHSGRAIFFYLTVLREQQGCDLQSPRQQEGLMTNPDLTKGVCDTFSGIHLISGRWSLVIELLQSSCSPQDTAASLHSLVLSAKSDWQGEKERKNPALLMASSVLQYPLQTVIILPRAFVIRAESLWHDVI